MLPLLLAQRRCCAKTVLRRAAAGHAAFDGITGSNACSYTTSLLGPTLEPQVTLFTAGQVFGLFVSPRRLAPLLTWEMPPG
jgi:hypothetical protein